MEMQQVDVNDIQGFADNESRTLCETCRLLLIGLLMIGILFDIIAIVYYTTVPAGKNDVIIVLGVLLSCIIVACGVITYCRSHRSSKLSYNFRSSSEEIYDAPWSIGEEVEDYGVINREMQSSIPRNVTKVGAHPTRNQRHLKHPISSRELDTLECKSKDNKESFNCFNDRPELVQHQVRSGNKMEYTHRSFEEKDECHRRDHRRKGWSPNSSLEATGYQYEESNQIDRGNLKENEYWSRRSRCRNRSIQEHGIEPNVHQSKNAKLSKRQSRSKSETRDYKAERNRTVRENLSLSNIHLKQNSSRWNKETEYSVVNDTERDEYKNMRRHVQLQLRKSDSNLYLSRRNRKYLENENTYNQNVTKNKQYISQCNRKTSEYPSNVGENIVPVIDKCSSTSKTYKNYPSLHRQHMEPFPLPSETERSQYASKDGRKAICSLANVQRIGNGIRPVHLKDGKKNSNSAFETEVVAYLPRNTMHPQSPDNVETRLLSPKSVTGKGRYSVERSIPTVPFLSKRGENLELHYVKRSPAEYSSENSEGAAFSEQTAIESSLQVSQKSVIGEGRYSVRSSVPTMPFLSRRNQNLECHNMKYSFIGKGSSAEYSPESSKGASFSEQTVIKSSHQASGRQEQNMWTNFPHLRQNSPNHRIAKDPQSETRNKYSEAINQSLNLGNMRYILRNNGMEYSRNVTNPSRNRQRIGEYEFERNEEMIDSLKNNRECMSSRYNIAPVTERGEERYNRHLI